MSTPIIDINALNLPAQDVRVENNVLLWDDDQKVRAHAASINTHQEYLDAMKRSIISIVSQINANGGGGGGTGGLNVSQKATFIIGIGINIPANIGVTVAEWDAAFTKEQFGVTFNTAVWKYCLISALNPPTSGDFIMDLLLDGVSIFDGAFLTLPNGTAAEDIITATNFATPQSAIVEKTSKITAEVRQTGPEVMNLTAIVMFDLIQL